MPDILLIIILKCTTAWLLYHSILHRKGLMEPERDTRAGEAGSSADRAAGLLRLLKGVDSQLVSDHLARMDAEYLRRYSDKEVARHLGCYH